MPIAISEFLIKNKLLIAIQSFLLFLIVLLWSYGDRIIDAHTKTEMSKLLQIQLIATLTILCIALFVACLDLLKRIKNQKNAYRRERISQWRKMLFEISNKKDNSDKPVSYLLERHEAYYSLEPHLSLETISEIARQRTFIAGATIDASLKFIVREIARLEKEWDLI